jgi:uncharacterized glyoxalase superfamily protein PhnB
MADATVRPPHMPWLSPYLTVKDADEALNFYQQAFGFQKRDAVKGPDGRTTHAEMTYRDAVIMFSPEGSFGDKVSKCPASLGLQSTTTLYLYCDDVDALCARARAAGVKVISEPQDAFWGDRICTLADPSGNLWIFARYLGPGAEKAPPAQA